MKLPLLIIQSPQDGLIEINGRAVGETADPICLPVSENGVLYITLIPLLDKPGTRFYPVTKKVVFANGALQPPIADGSAEFIAWPADMYQMIMQAGCLSADTELQFPFTIASIDWLQQARYSATLFWDDALCLAVEDASGQMVFGHTLQTRSREGTLRLMKGGTLLIATGPCERGEYLLCLGMKNGAVSVLLEMEADAFFWDKEETQFTCIDRLPTCRLHEQLIQYAYQGGEWVQTSRDAPSPTRPVQTPQDLVNAFAEAVAYQFDLEAIGYLSRALSDGLDFDTLKQFLGPFSRHTLPEFVSATPEGEVVLGLYNHEQPISRGRLFALAVEKEIGFHISNIREW